MVKEIPLTKGYIALVDDDDFETLNKMTWWVTPAYSRNGDLLGYYAYTKINGKTTYMHRLIMNAPKGLTVDHINKDRLNNTKLNLRLASQAQNNANTKARSGTSLYKGVRDSNRRLSKRWVASISVNNKYIHLGYFSTEVEAARAYNHAALKYFGEYASLNDLQEAS